LGVSVRSVQRTWVTARAWLRKDLREFEPTDPAGCAKSRRSEVPRWRLDRA
jgi:hypothetical protein